MIREHIVERVPQWLRVPISEWVSSSHSHETRSALSQQVHTRNHWELKHSQHNPNSQSAGRARSRELPVLQILWRAGAGARQAAQEGRVCLNFHPRFSPEIAAEQSWAPAAWVKQMPEWAPQSIQGRPGANWEEKNSPKYKQLVPDDVDTEGLNMKMKSRLTDNEAGECRRQAKPENSPVRTGLGGRASSSRVIPSKVVSKGSSGSPGPRTTSGAGRTPQTKRRELSLSTAEKNSPSGSPRNVSRTSSSGNVVRKSAPTSKTKGDQRNGSEVSANNEESSRKSSNSSQDSGIGRESKMTRGERTRSGHNLTKSLRSQPPPPLIRTNSPPRSDIEVSDRKRFEELCDIKNIELGMVKVPPDILEDLINKENIEKFYDVDEVPVAR